MLIHNDVMSFSDLYQFIAISSEFQVSYISSMAQNLEAMILLLP